MLTGAGGRQIGRANANALAAEGDAGEDYGAGGVIGIGGNPNPSTAGRGLAAQPVGEGGDLGGGVEALEQFGSGLRQLSRLQGQAFSGIGCTRWQFELSKTGLAAVEHFTWGQASERAKARATSHGGVDTELAVSAANGIVVDNGAAIHQHSLMERGIGIPHSAGEHN